MNRLFCFLYFPATCSDVPVPCIHGQNYADATNCFRYFHCADDALTLLNCNIGQGFDIYDRECVTITADFNCGYRCITTAVPTTLAPTTEIQASVIETSASQSTAHPNSTIQDQTTLPDTTTEGTTLLHTTAEGTTLPDTTAGGTTLPDTTAEATQVSAKDQPIVCNDVPTPCINSEKYAHASDCTLYYECMASTLVLQSCREEYGFDIYERECIPIYGIPFDCDYRCLVTSAPAVTQSVMRKEESKGECIYYFLS